MVNINESGPISESDWKRSLIEQEIKIQQVKAVLTDPEGVKSSTFEIQSAVDELVKLNKKLIIEKQAIEEQKQQQIQALALQVKSLE